MKLEKINPDLDTEHKHKKVNSIREILNRIFEISLIDSNFSINSRIESLNLEILEIEKKLKTQNEILVRSKKIREKIDSKLESLDDENFNRRVQLLEKMGSEL
jgi:hypothetical protein